MRFLTKSLSKFLIASLCAVIVISMFVLTPDVDAASETPITETNKTDTNNDKSQKDDDLALARAIAIDEAKQEAQNAVEELAAQMAEEEKSEQDELTEETQVEESQPQAEETQPEEDDESSGSSTSESEQCGSYVTGASGTGYLIDINNPDPGYVSYSIALSDSDRDLAERIVMGEAGYDGYTAMVLVAQCLRDAFVSGGYSDIRTTADDWGYYGSRSFTPSQSCKDAVSFIFDQGGAAVQHRVMVFYASDYCSSPWHESQKFICACGSERFFDTID